MRKVEQLISWGSNSVTNARWTKKTKQKMAGSYCLWPLWSSNCRWRVAQRRLNARTNAGRRGTENQLMGQFQQCPSFIFILELFQWIDKVPRGLQEQHGIQGACHPHWLLPQHPWGGLEEGGKEVIWLILLLSLLLIIDETSNLKVANVTSSSRPSGRQWSDCHHPNTLQ